MGFYIETTVNKGKAEAILTLVDAKREAGPFYDPTGKRVGVCVVDNGPFEAAGIAFSEREMEAFAEPDGRRKTWLSVTKELAIQLCPSVKAVLK